MSYNFQVFRSEISRLLARNFGKGVSLNIYIVSVRENSELYLSEVLVFFSLRDRETERRAR